MKILFIFDKVIPKETIKKLVKSDITQITLFPLTSHSQIVDATQNEIQAVGDISTTLIGSAKIINAEVDIMQKTIHQWSSSLGDYQIGKKKLKEWFLLPDKNVSSWWFGLISEKNTAHDGVFFKIAQINAIAKHLEKHKYDYCFVAISDRKVGKILLKIAHNSNIHMSTLSQKNFSIFTNKIYSLGIFAKAAIILAKWLAYSVFIRHVMTPLKERLPENNPLLFVSYFPHVDVDKAKEGKFRNKYALAIQDKLHALGIPITWLLMPVNYNDYDLKSGIQLARKFSENGEKILVLYEFFTLRIFLKSFYWWLRQIIISSLLFNFIDEDTLTSPLTHKECQPMIKYLWQHSFIGASGIRGILFYLTYQEIFSKVPDITRCLYYCEMQAWEKALNAAKRSKSKHTRSLGFQHTIVMKNRFNYFYAKEEISEANTLLGLPLPDTFIVNSKLMHKLFTEYGYTQLYEAEAIRQLYLIDAIKNPDMRLADKPILLVAGSFDKMETKSLISMVYAAFPILNKFEIWFKAYPSTPIESLFTELDIDIDKSGYKIISDDISTLLSVVSIVFVSGSTIAVEALAYGCKVIVPIFSDIMQFNPLVDFTSEYILVSSADQFNAVVENEIQNKKIISNAESRNFMQKYWNLDANLPLWEKILTSA